MADDDEPLLTFKTVKCPDDSVIPYRANIATPTSLEALRFHYQQELKAIERSFQSLLDSLECQTIEIPMPDDEDIDQEEDCFTICCFTKDPNTGGLVAVVPKEGQVLAWSEELQCYLPKDECCDGEGFIDICGPTIVPGEPGECTEWGISGSTATASTIHLTDTAQDAAAVNSGIDRGSVMHARNNEIWVQEFQLDAGAGRTLQFHHSTDGGQNWSIPDYSTIPTAFSKIPIDRDWAEAERLAAGDPEANALNYSYEATNYLGTVGYYPQYKWLMTSWHWEAGQLIGVFVEYRGGTPYCSFKAGMGGGIQFGGFAFNSPKDGIGGDAGYIDYGITPHHRIFDFAGNVHFGWLREYPNGSFAFGINKGEEGAYLFNGPQWDVYRVFDLNSYHVTDMFRAGPEVGFFDKAIEVGEDYQCTFNFNGSNWVYVGPDPAIQTDVFEYKDGAADGGLWQITSNPWTVVRPPGVAADYIIGQRNRQGLATKFTSPDDPVALDYSVDLTYTNRFTYRIEYIEQKRIFILAEVDGQTLNKMILRGSVTGVPGEFTDPVEITLPEKMNVAASGILIRWLRDQNQFVASYLDVNLFTRTVVFDDNFVCLAGEEGEDDAIFENEPKDGDILVYDGANECWNYEQPLFGATDLINDQITALDSTWSSSKINEKNNEILSFIRDSVVVASYGGVRLAAETAMADLGAGWETVPFDTETLSSPIRVQQNPTTNSIVVASKGVWTVNFNMTLEHNESNSGREMLIRFYNLTDDVALASGTTVFVARNQPGTNISVTILADITDAVGKDIVVQLSGGTDSFTLVNAVDASFFATNSSPVAGLI